MAYRKTNVRAGDHIPVPGGLETGSQIVVRGRVLEHETRFALNLKLGEDGGDDIAFHFNPRNDDGDAVVRNTRTGGDWGEEERDIPRFPFDNGRKFTVRVMVHEGHYNVLVNNRPFCTYGHRIAPQEVTFLELGEGAEYYEALVQNNCRAPFRSHFPGGLRVGQAVRVRGMVKDDATRFHVNFQMDRDGDDVGFHFNPRQDEEDVVLNAKLGGDWGDEQRGYENDFAFKQGMFFDCFFIAVHERFNVYVNEQFFATFEYRCDHHDMRHLYIEGDVELMDVELLDPLPDDFIKEVPQGLEKHDMVVTKGFFYPEGERFAVNLIKGCNCDDDIALHVNPRRGEGEVVFNSKEDGGWEDEERHALPRCMHDMVPFEVQILTKKDKYKVYANEKKICKFRARDDIESVRAINVQGDAYLYEVKLLRRLDEPFTDALPGLLQAGNWIVLNGAPDDDEEGFAVNLQCDEDTDSDVAFHFNVRFNEGEVVRNAREGGDWGSEERDGGFPFDIDDKFELAFCIAHHGIRVFVNHRHFTDFHFRMAPERITHIHLTGGCDYYEPEFY